MKSKSLCYLPTYIPTYILIIKRINRDTRKMEGGRNLRPMICDVFFSHEFSI